MTLYDVLRRPIETEKSRHQNAKLHQYVFEVNAKATKPQIKEAVETLFDVEVQRVNVIVSPAKKGRRGRSRTRSFPVPIDRPAPPNHVPIRPA